MSSAIDLDAEAAERDRLREHDEACIDRLLETKGLDAAGLYPALEALLGWKAGTLAAAQAPCSGERRTHSAGPAADRLELDTFEVSGRVKFFDALKNYGFIVPDDGRPDVLLHISCLQASGHVTVHAGARVQVLVFNGPKGLQALRVLSMDESTAVDPAQVDQRTHAKVQPESDWVEVVVRWYNVQRGFGFVHEKEGAPDIFVHAETLRRWGVAALRPGQKVEVRWGTTGKGLMVAEIRIIRGSLTEAA
jgi:CspA family cold shock protein